MFSVYGYSKDTGFDFAQFNYILTDIHEMLLNSEAMSPSFLLFSVQKRISKTEVIESTFSTYCYW